MIVKKMIFIYMYTIINDNPFENLKKLKCVKNCDFNEMLQKICILKFVTNETITQVSWQNFRKKILNNNM